MYTPKLFYLRENQTGKTEGGGEEREKRGGKKKRKHQTRCKDHKMMCLLMIPVKASTENVVDELTR